MSNLLMQDLATIEAITWNVYGQRIGEYEQFVPWTSIVTEMINREKGLTCSQGKV